MNRQSRRWDPCVIHRAHVATEFLAQLFAETHRRILLIAGAGFDPRSAAACELIAGAASGRIGALLIREERPNPDQRLVQRADANTDRMTRLIPTATVARINIFANDGAATGGRAVIAEVRARSLVEVTDVVVDLSALSIGIAYPVVRLLDQLIGRSQHIVNLHLVVNDEPLLDGAIQPEATDRASTVHGFQGGFGLDSNSRAIKLWLPQLIRGKRSILERIYQYLTPDEVCPILPFPSRDARLADKLLDHYRPEIESAWGVDARHLVYADERNPLDLYRSILTIADARHRVFERVGGSLILLSPLGSKALAVGSLMAAIERDFPVVHVEALSYTADFDRLDARNATDAELVHLWLAGEAWPAKTAPETTDGQRRQDN